MNLKLNLNLFEVNKFNLDDFNLYFYLLHYAFELKKKEELKIYTPFFKDTDILIIIDNKEVENYLSIFQFFYKLQGRVKVLNLNQNFEIYNNIFNFYKYIIFFALNNNSESKIISNLNSNYNGIYFNLNKNFFTIFFIFSIIFNFYELIQNDLDSIKLEIEQEIIDKDKLNFLYNLISKDTLKLVIDNLPVDKEKLDFIINFYSNFELKLLKFKTNEYYQIKIGLNDIFLNLMFILESFFINYLRYVN
ncbi:MAG: hypothetical protein ACP5O4_04315 [bacterium]